MIAFPGLPRSAKRSVSSFSALNLARTPAASRPRGCRMLLLFLGLACLAAAPALAQTAQFSGALATLGGGFNSPEGVAVDAAGNVYLADTGNNAVEEMPLGCTSSSCITTLGNGFAFSQPTGVAVDAGGNVYVADTGNHAVEKIAPGGAVTTLANSSSLFPFTDPYGVAVDASGNVYVADGNYSTVEEIETGGTVLELGGGFSNPHGVALDSSGNIYVADSGNRAVKELAPSCTADLYGTDSGSCVTTLGGSFVYDKGVAVDAAGNVYVADFSSNGIRVRILPPNCTAADYSSDSCTTTIVGGGIVEPWGIAVDASGNIYVADSGGNAVREIMPQAANLFSSPLNTAAATETLYFTFTAGGSIAAPVVLTQGIPNLDFKDAGTGTCTVNGASYDYNSGDTCTVDVTFKPAHPGPRYGAAELVTGSGALLATAYVHGTGEGPQVIFSSNNALSILASGFYQPGGVAVDGAGNVFVADTANSAVREILAAGGYTTVNTLGSGFSYPNSVAVDAAGNVFVADTANSAVKEILAVGGYTTVETLGSGFSQPYGVAVDGSGNVFVADTVNNEVKEIVAAGGYTTVKTLGSGFSNPTGVAVDGAGNVFVADSGNSFVEEIPAASGYTEVDDLDIGFGFSNPSGVALDGAGDVFVADSGNNAVEEILAAGGYTSLNVLSSTFTYPEGVAVDGSGNVFIADTGNSAVKEMDFSDGPTLSFATTAAGSTSADSPQTVTVANDGNQNLTFSSIAYGTDYPEAPEVDTDCDTYTAVAPASTCTLTIEFSPLGSSATGASTFLPEAVTLTDNGSTSTQSVTLDGTETATPTAPFGAMLAPRDAVTQATSVQQGDGLLVTGWAADATDGAPVSRVSILIDGTAVGNATLGIARPSTAKQYGARYLDAGWTYTYSGSLTAGTHTVAAIAYDSLGLSTQLGSRKVTVTAAAAPPFGAVTVAGDAITQTTPVGQSDGLLVTGWAADLVQGAPVSQVTIELDGSPLGNATLGIADQSVVTSTGDSSLLDSGWTFSYSGPALTLGSHTVSVIATDSASRSATLGTSAITVQANAPPFGAMTAPVDTITGSTTVEQGDSLRVNGWAADVHDGAPVSSVSIVIDGSAVGNATLDIARPSTANQYGSSYLNSGWTYTYSGTLAAGTHTIAAVAYDSLGLSTQFPTRTFTVTAAAAPPFGAVTAVGDAVTKSTPVGQSDGLLVTGWAADLAQGAPVSQVTILLDGTPIGNATLGIADQSVVTSTGNSSLLDSGWTFTYTGAALTIGTHTVSVIAYDSGSRSATLGTSTITVQANAPPFGALSPPTDATTGSTTVTEGDSVLVSGWAADAHDGAPVSSVAIYIDCTTSVADCTPVGNATLNIAHPSTAKTYGSRYLHSGWTYTYSGSLTAGTHTVTAVAWDSLGLSTQFATRTFTVSP